MFVLTHVQVWQAPFLAGLFSNAGVWRASTGLFVEPVVSHSGALYERGFAELTVGGWTVRDAWHAWWTGSVAVARWIGCTLPEHAPYRCANV